MKEKIAKSILVIYFVTAYIAVFYFCIFKFFFSLDLPFITNLSICVIYLMLFFVFDYILSPQRKYFASIYCVNKELGFVMIDVFDYSSNRLRSEEGIYYSPKVHLFFKSFLIKEGEKHYEREHCYYIERRGFATNFIYVSKIEK